MRGLIAAVALSAMLCAACGNAAEGTAKGPQQIVEQREAGMKAKLVGGLKAASEAATPAEAKAKLAEAIAFAESIPALFPKGTGIGDPGITHTRAVQDIWAKWDEFKAAADGLVAALKQTDAAIDSGDKAKVEEGFSAVRKACGTCHTPFRGPETD